MKYCINMDLNTLPEIYYILRNGSVIEIRKRVNNKYIIETSANLMLRQKATFRYVSEEEYSYIPTDCKIMKIQQN